METIAYLVLMIVGVIIYVIIYLARLGKTLTHKENLRKGGLIPRVSKSIHEEALRQIYRETPNVLATKKPVF